MVKYKYLVCATVLPSFSTVYTINVFTFIAFVCLLILHYPYITWIILWYWFQQIIYFHYGIFYFFTKYRWVTTISRVFAAVLVVRITFLLVYQNNWRLFSMISNLKYFETDILHFFYITVSTTFLFSFIISYHSKTKIQNSPGFIMRICT